jgi:hypothetical protein
MRYRKEKKDKRWLLGTKPLKGATRVYSHAGYRQGRRRKEAHGTPSLLLAVFGLGQVGHSSPSRSQETDNGEVEVNDRLPRSSRLSLATNTHGGAWRDRCLADRRRGWNWDGRKVLGNDNSLFRAVILGVRGCGDLGDLLGDTQGANLLLLLRLIDRSLAGLRLIGLFLLGLLGRLLLFLLLVLFRLLLLSGLLCFRSHLRHLARLFRRKFFLLLLCPEAASDLLEPRLVGALGGELGRAGSYIRSVYVMLVFLSASWRCLTLDCALHLLDPLVRLIDHRLALSVPLFLQLLKGASWKDLIELEDLSKACLDHLLISVFAAGFCSVYEPLDVAPDLAHCHRLLGDFAVNDTGTLGRDVGDLVHRSHDTGGLGRMKDGVLGGFGRTTLQVRHLVGRDVGDLAHRIHETGGLGRMKDGVLGGFGRTTFQVRHLVGSAKEGRKELRLGGWD